MNKNYKKIKNMFLAQSYQDSWLEYQKSLRKTSYAVWDYVILTASNEEQAMAYRSQIEYRLKAGFLPLRTRYVVLPDPEGKRVGSGGATFNVLRYIAEQDGEAYTENHFKGKRILVIHSGGDSKRVPQYSAIGKLFSPVPRELPDGRASTLFDEFIIGMSAVAGRMPEGMVVMSGDVLLLFNPLQIDAQFDGAAAISIKENVEIGKNHGVFLNDGTDHVARFLHKQTVEQLRNYGAVNDNDAVDLDTGAVILDVKLLNSLYSLISTDNKNDSLKFDEFVNEKARISFYGDFLYPLAEKSTLEDYYNEAPEGSFCEELTSCRTKIWNTISSYRLKLICLAPAEFIHFGTTRELRELVTNSVDDYEFLDWKRLVMTNLDGSQHTYAVNNSLVSENTVIGEGVYIEDCCVGGNVKIADGAVLSHVNAENISVPADIVLHGVELKGGRYVVRVYGVTDNPKGSYEDDTPFLGTTLRKLVELSKATPDEIWDEDRYLWFAKLYPVCDSMEEAVTWALKLVKLAEGRASESELEEWKSLPRMSLCSSFNEADVQSIVPWNRNLENSIMVERFVSALKAKVGYEDALNAFGVMGISQTLFELLLSRAEEEDFLTRVRIYYAISRYMRKASIAFSYNNKACDYELLENMCFDEIRDVIYENGKEKIPDISNLKISKDRVDVALPVRVNWGGGWTDTPPRCNESGGVVLNAAITLNGICPVQVTVKRLDELHIEFESADLEVSGIFENIEDIRDCHNPYDFFALHKAALIACGIVPISGECDLKDILAKLGGGIYLSTQVVGVPKGSGLGTSSILAGACVKALFDFLGQDIEDDVLYDVVLCMEQIMSTGGGWQDQVGGITPGIKFITTKPGINQKIEVQHVVLDEATMEELQDRFALIYTGQRRLARNLLRDVVGNYIGCRRESIDALNRMEKVAVLMRFALERGSVDEFAALLNEHWELSKQLDAGSTNTCIDQIFLACEDLIDGKFISGAGGGGFLQVILKKGITKEMLQKRLYNVFQDSGVSVWDTSFI